MQSPNTSAHNNIRYWNIKTAQHNFLSLKNDAGFTLIEVVIVMTIIVFLGTFGVIVGLDTYRRSNFHSEEDTAVSLLEKARSGAINNIGESWYGVKFDDASNLILFRGQGTPKDYVHRNSAYDLKIQKSGVLVYTGATEMVFNQLSGDSSGGIVTINSSNITINNEGGIDW